jgi:DNA-binding LacI/PurR family transcriptional regulator
VIDIRRLAEHLSISIGTVSRALNNRPGVHPETRTRVLHAATELGYVANASGRSLRRGATNTIGFVIETGSPANQAGDNFFYIVTDAMNEYLTERGYDLMILPCHSADDPVEYLARLVARGIVDALVITATRVQDQRIALLAKSTMPFLTLGRSETPGEYPWIDLDFEDVARRSVAELAAHGHRRIAVALPEKDVNLGQHYRAGYLAGMEAAGLPVDPGLILRVETSEEGGFDFGKQLAEMSDRPTAALLCSEATTVGLYGALRSSGLTPGADISIITFRENPQLRFLDPAPACFRTSLPDLGREMARAVLDLLADDASLARQRHVLWPMEFVPGSSIAAPIQSGQQSV